MEKGKAYKATTADILEAQPWEWPVNIHKYDRFPHLRDFEKTALVELGVRRGHCSYYPKRVKLALARLIVPLEETIQLTNAGRVARYTAITIMLLETARRQRSYWSWSPDECIETYGSSLGQFLDRYSRGAHARTVIIAVLYLLGIYQNTSRAGSLFHVSQANHIFGKQLTENACKTVLTAARAWGYGKDTEKKLRSQLCEALILNKSPRLRDLTTEFLDKQRRSSASEFKRSIWVSLSRVLANLEIIERPMARDWGRRRDILHTLALEGVAAPWKKMAERWFTTSTLQERTRMTYRGLILKAGRWITNVHGEAVHPSSWTRELAAEWVSVVLKMNTGEWSSSGFQQRQKNPTPMSPRHRAHLIVALSTFFRDCQEWEWISRRFDPRRAFAVPRSLRTLIGPRPRPLPDDIWAKALSAGLGLSSEDLGSQGAAKCNYYPIQMVRALGLVWLFSGLRSDEIVRLRIGCAKTKILDHQLAKEVCLLEVPPNKTSKAFVKPVDIVVGLAIQEWEKVRPLQATFVDRKTGERVEFLFAVRGTPISKRYLNKTLIKILCQKAGIPAQDAQGTITSHRARTTMATQLLNSPEHPMDIFELQRWLGHRSPSSTLYYLGISQTRLAESFRKTDHKNRNLRTVKILIDQDIIVKGEAATQPWKFYDLGHGYCTYDFFEQCPHRMACAKCEFYRPKGSTEAQLLEGKQNLLHMRQEIPLRPPELDAVNEGIKAFERLIQQLADVPTPSGQTPRQIAKNQPDKASEQAQSSLETPWIKKPR